MRLVASQWPDSCVARKRRLFWKLARRSTATLKRIVPVTPRRSFCLQDNTGQIIPRFLIISLLYHICLSRRNARSTGWLGRAKRSRARSHREDAPTDSLAAFWEGGCPKEKMDGGCRCVCVQLTRAAIISAINSPTFHASFLPALESARLSCRLAVRWLFSRCTRTIGLTAGGAEWLCHGCVYTCLSLHCAVHTYMQAASTVRCFDKSSPLRLARLSLLLRWLADWLDVKRNMQAVFVIGLTRSWSARDKQG